MNRLYAWLTAKVDAHAWIAPTVIIALFAVVQALDAMDGVTP